MDLLPLEIQAGPRTSALNVLKANVSRAEAVAQFDSMGARKWGLPFLAPLRSIAEIYIPFQLFNAKITQRQITECKIMAVDLLSGDLDPFSFPSLPRPDQMTRIESRNHAHPRLTLQEVQSKLETKLQRLFFQSGFFRVGNLSIAIEPVEMLFVPYWVGFFGSGANASVEVLDAVRRVREGSKVRTAVLEWLMDETVA